MRKTILFASTLALVGCGNRDFNKPELLNQPRILAVQAEPPQPSFGTATTLRTLVYQPPLTANSENCPNPSAAPTYQWSWCPWPTSANDNYACPTPESDFDQLYAGLGLGTAPAFDLGTSATATFTNPFPAKLLYALCRGDLGSMLGGSGAGAADGGTGSSIFYCDLPAGETHNAAPGSTHPIGFTVTIKVIVTPPCASSLPAAFSPLTAVYSLHLPTDETIPVNQNPVLTKIWVTDHIADGGAPTGAPIDDGGGISSDASVVSEDDGGTTPVDAAPTPDDASVPPTAPPGALALDDYGSVPVERQQHVGLKLDIPMSSSEFLPVPSSIDYNSPDSTTRHYEHLNFAWFAEAGDFGSDGKGGHDTGYLPALRQPTEAPWSPTPADDQGFDLATSNTWNPPKVEDYAVNRARIVVVVRDGRGGVAWTSGVASLEDRP
jgi:hypothetical protein